MLLINFFFEKSPIRCKSIVGIDASQEHPYLMCQPMPTGFLRVRISIHRQIVLHLDKTRPIALNIWSFSIISEQDQIAKSRASLQQAHRKKLAASVLMAFFLLATLCLKPWAAFITFVSVKKIDRPSLRKIFNVVARKENSMN